MPAVFVNDEAPRAVIEVLAAGGVKLILLRCAGFNNVDLTAAREYGIKVLRVPAYSPYAVAEHAMTIIQAANRRIHKSYTKVRDNNFSREDIPPLSTQYVCTLVALADGR